MPTLKTFALGAVFFASSAFASSVEKVVFDGAQATCSCKNKGDCTCARGQCKCKNCGNGAKGTKLVESLKGATETTRLPETARYDARGGIFL